MLQEEKLQERKSALDAFFKGKVENYAENEPQSGPTSSFYISCIFYKDFKITL
jgi:hypothetical protein